MLQVHVKSANSIQDLLELTEHRSTANSTKVHGHSALFNGFIEKHGRTYTPGSPDYVWRRRLFMQRAEEAARHNAKPDRLWTAGVNPLTDRSDEELRALLGWSGVAAPEAASNAGPLSFLQTSMTSSMSSIHPWGQAMPEDVTWGNLNATQLVVNQGACGSCWAVSAASVLQAHMEIHAPDRARPLSVEELVACVENVHHCGGSGACNGATPELAMDYALRHGLASASASATAELDAKPSHIKCPRRSSSTVGNSLVQGSQDSELQLDVSSPGVHYGTSSALSESRAIGMRSWERLPPNTYTPLMQALVHRGPAAVAVFASAWFSYSHGVFDGCEKDAVIDHAVALLGYGNDHKLRSKYWLVQNSWGPDWGEHGRIRLRRRSNDDAEHCGVDAQPEVGTGCDGGPKQVKVCGMCGILYDAVVPHF